MAPATIIRKNHTIESMIVLDALEASTCIREPHQLAGGMAVQLYLPQEFHRYTTDVDFDLDGKHTFCDIKKLMKEGVEYLKDAGYNVSWKKIVTLMI